jgi:hypothetical protein
MATKKTVAKKPAKKVADKEQPVELKKLVIKIHGKELELTPKEALELKAILDELYDESKEIEKVQIIHEHIYPYTYPYVYPQPIYVKPYEWTKVWYGDAVNTTTTGTTGNFNSVTSTWATTCNNAGTFTCSCG